MTPQTASGSYDNRRVVLRFLLARSILRSTLLLLTYTQLFRNPVNVLSN